MQPKRVLVALAGTSADPDVIRLVASIAKPARASVIGIHVIEVRWNLPLDAVMEPGNEPHPAKWFDLHMMVALGGRERTREEFEALLHATGFALRSAISLPAPIGVIEADPI